MATHLSRHFQSAGAELACIYSRSQGSAVALAGSLGCPAISDPDQLPGDADYYILCVPDRAVPLLAEQFRHRRGTWLHTSGSLPAEIFRGCHQNYGVLYPLQTLVSQRPISLHDTPFLVEGSDPGVTERIRTLAKLISGNVQVTDHRARLTLHLAAVFASNFSNHMVTIAQSILEDEGKDPGILDPLIRETFARLSAFRAALAQTGPAIRGDEETMRNHLEMLKGKPEWEKIYTFISGDIQKSGRG